MQHLTYPYPISNIISHITTSYHITSYHITSYHHTTTPSGPHHPVGGLQRGHDHISPHHTITPPHPADLIIPWGDYSGGMITPHEDWARRRYPALDMMVMHITKKLEEFDTYNSIVRRAKSPMVWIVCANMVISAFCLFVWLVDWLIDWVYWMIDWLIRFIEWKVYILFL